MRLVPVLVATIALAGCTDAPAGGESPEPRVVSLSDGVPVAVEGEDFEVVGEVLGRLDGRWATFRGRADDGTEVYTREARVWDYGLEVPVGGRVAPPQPQRRAGAKDPRQVALVVRGPGGGETRVVSAHARRSPGLEHRQVRVAGHHVVWVESTNERFGALWALDLRTGRETRLVAGDGREVPWPSGHARPVVQDEVVHFVGHRPGVPPANSDDTAVYAVPLDGGAAPREVVPRARDVHPAPGGLLDVVIGARLVRWDPDEGEIAGSALDADASAADDSGVRVAFDESADVLRVESDRHGDLEVRLDGHVVADLRAGEDWVAFTVSDWNRAALLGLESGTLRRLDESREASATPAGSDYVYEALGVTVVPLAPESHRVIRLLPHD